MIETEIHKCILSYGMIPMSKIIYELELEERYEECAVIFNAFNSFLAQYPAIINESWRKYSQQVEDEWIENIKKVTNTDGSIARDNLKYYLKDIKERLKL